MGKTQARGRAVALGFVLAVILLTRPFALALNPRLDASQYAHTAWKVREGFTKGFIYAITQTPDGYLWLATEFGLLRFDGVRNVPWQPPQGQKLPSTDIRALLSARDGTLWIGTGKGLASWKDGKLTQYRELAGYNVVVLVEDREGSVWAGAWGVPTGRLCAMQNGNIHCYGDDGSIGLGVSNLFVQGDGSLWVGVQNGLWRWRPGPPKFYAVQGEASGIRGLGEDNDGTLLIGIRGGLWRFLDGKIEPYLLSQVAPQFKTRRLLRDHDGGLWIGTQGEGLMHVHQGKTDVFAPSDGLTGDDVLTLFEDREGTVWVATLNGLDRFRDFAVATLTEHQGLSSARVGSVLADSDGSVWLATSVGLNRWDSDLIAVPPTGLTKRDGKLNGLAPESLFQDDVGRIWISTSDGVGYLANHRFIPIRGVPGGLVHSITEDSEGNMWITNLDYGLFRVSLGGQVQQIPWAKLGRKDYASALAADRLHGGLWLGFVSGGIAHFDKGQVLASYSAVDGLGEGRVNSFQFDQDGTVWIATEHGLSRLKDGHRIATLNSGNGLPCDAVHWVKEDDAKSFWLYMSCSLVRIARSDLEAWAAGVDQDGTNKVRTIQVAVLDDSDGVRGRVVSTRYNPNVAKASDGRLWFLPVDGVSIVDPRHLAFNKLPPPVHIEQIIADRKTHEPSFNSTGTSSASLRLPPLVRELEIDYTALSLVAPEKVLFRYKLEGFDPDWQDAGTRRQAFYTNLPPRNYRFRVMACNNSGVWNEAGTFVDFSIAPAFYQRAWFRLSSVAAFLALLWAVYQFQLRQATQQVRQRIEGRFEERERIARELHDTLLQSFQGVLLYLRRVSSLLANGPQDAKERLDEAMDKAEQAILEGRNAVQGLRAPANETDDLPTALRTLGEELSVNTTNQYSPVLDIGVEGQPQRLHLLLRDEVFRIAGEALHNAFRHAHARRIEVEIHYGERWFRVRVRDDGRGMDSQVVPNQGSAGHWGLLGMHERAKLVGARLEVWSKVDLGTEIQLTIPASAAYEAPISRARPWFS